MANLYNRLKQELRLDIGERYVSSNTSHFSEHEWLTSE